MPTWEAASRPHRRISLGHDVQVSGIPEARDLSPSLALRKTSVAYARTREASERATDDTDKPQAPYADLRRGTHGHLTEKNGPNIRIGMASTVGHGMAWQHGQAYACICTDIGHSQLAARDFGLFCGIRRTALILYGGPYYNFWGLPPPGPSLRRFFAAAAPPSLSLARFMQKQSTSVWFQKWVQKKRKNLHFTLLLVAVNRVRRESSEPSRGRRRVSGKSEAASYAQISFTTLWFADTLPGTYCIRTWLRIDAEVCSDLKTDLPERSAPSPVPRT
ncbi:hypothetical protein Landi51_09922 [Colletotrichum acutatum]